MMGFDNRYEVDKSLQTNAGVLNVGDPLTRSQIDALAHLEDMFVTMRGNVGNITRDVEAVLHAFMCNGLLECVCATKRRLEL